MKTAITIFFILVAIFALAVIVASVRRAIHKSREIEAEITRDEYRQIHPSVKEKWDTCREVTSAPRRVGMHPALGVGYGQHVPMAFNPDTDEFFPANQLPGYPFGDEPDDELPAAMLSPPNIGGIGHPEYRGANYVPAEEIADEMKGIIQWSEPDGTEFDGGSGK